MTRSGIYSIRNIMNGNAYIGSAVNLRKRQQNHFSDLRQGKHHNVHLQRAFDKYGQDAFVFNVLEYCAPALLVISEQKWIDALGPTYNIRTVAQSNLGLVMDDSFRRKISDRCRGRKLSDEHRLHISQGGKGRVFSTGHRRRLSEARIGIVLSDETRNRISEAKRGIPWSPKRRAAQGDSDGKT